MALQKTKQTTNDKSRITNPIYEQCIYFTVKINHNFIQALVLDFGVLVLISNHISNCGKPLKSLSRRLRRF